MFRLIALGALFWVSSSFAEKKERSYFHSRFCEDASARYKKSRWGRFYCPKTPAKVFGFSVMQRPLVYFEFGEASSETFTLVQCGIHGDELPALPMCLSLIREIETEVRKVPKGGRLLVQPLLNPDGMFRAKPTRQNASGVDINRNFPTDDWDKEALPSWKRKDKEDPRKYPGPFSNSEPETQAIVRVIDQYKPQKIISIHTPLGFLDLDSHGDKDMQRRAKFLAINMSKNSGNYRFIRFGFYPGSLGNFAGRHREIPVYTLELPSGVSRPTIDQYWKKFRVALWRAIDFDLSTGTFIED